MPSTPRSAALADCLRRRRATPAKAGAIAATTMAVGTWSSQSIVSTLGQVERFSPGAGPGAHHRHAKCLALTLRSPRIGLHRSPSRKKDATLPDRFGALWG